MTSNTATVTVVPPNCPAPPSTIAAPSSVVGGTQYFQGASVAVPTEGATYQWSITGGSIQSGSQAAVMTFTAGCSGTVKLTLTVTANCGTSSTSNKEIPIVGTPSVALSGSTVNQGTNGTLTATLQGTSPWTLTWSDGLQENNISGPSHQRTVTAGQTTSYSVTARDAKSCEATSNTATVTVIPPAPVLIGAAAAAFDRVLVQWSFSGSADSFEVDRLDRIGGVPPEYRLITCQPVTATSCLDIGLPAGTSALYRVRAVKGGTSSQPSGFDLATTTMFADDPIMMYATPVRAVHITQLRTAVNAVRSLAGYGPATFSDVGLSPSWTIRAVHITDLRGALDVARSALNLPALTYEDTPLASGNPIRAVHVTNLRGGVQ